MPKLLTGRRRQARELRDPPLSLDHQLGGVPPVHLSGPTASFFELVELKPGMTKAVELVPAARHGPGPMSLRRRRQAVMRTGRPRALQLRPAG